MVFKYNFKDAKSIKLTAILIMSVFLSCPASKADGEFSYFDFNEIPSIKLINPIYLDTARTEKTVHNTSIPFNLRGDFNEADYFTSNMDELPQSNAPPPVDFANLPPPSEYVKIHSVAEKNFS